MTTAPTFFLTPKPLETISTASDLKIRLDWGEPALTIIDVRSRSLFNENRILGAISMPIDELIARASASLESERDIYVYGETNEMTADAVAKLREAGYENVAELKGGLTDWQATGGATEGTVAVAA
ncbi:MAG: rhodanese-like domain-containing protein [Leptolyngbyaceae cyanobacterium]